MINNYNEISMEVSDVNTLSSTIDRLAGDIREAMKKAYQSLENLTKAGFISGTIKVSLDEGVRQMMAEVASLKRTVIDMKNNIQQNVQDTVSIDEYYSAIFQKLADIDPATYYTE